MLQKKMTAAIVDREPLVFFEGSASSTSSGKS
jgi:hypothetical protein